jgi:hypothetical protein
MNIIALADVRELVGQLPDGHPERLEMAPRRRDGDAGPRPISWLFSFRRPRSASGDVRMTRLGVDAAAIVAMLLYRD